MRIENIVTNKITHQSISAEIQIFQPTPVDPKDHAHNIAMLILNHAAPIGASPDAQGSNNCSSATALVAKMPAPWAERLIQWFRLYSPIRFKGGKAYYCAEYKELKFSSFMTENEIKTISTKRQKWWNIKEASYYPFYADGIQAIAISDNRYRVSPSVTLYVIRHMGIWLDINKSVERSIKHGSGHKKVTFEKADYILRDSKYFIGFVDRLLQLGCSAQIGGITVYSRQDLDAILPESFIYVASSDALQIFENMQNVDP